MDVESFLLFQNQQIIITLGSHQIVWQNRTLFIFSVHKKNSPIQNSSIQNSPTKHERYKKNSLLKNCPNYGRHLAAIAGSKFCRPFGGKLATRGATPVVNTMLFILVEHKQHKINIT